MTPKQMVLPFPQHEKQLYLAQMQPSIPVFLEKGATIHS